MTDVQQPLLSRPRPSTDIPSFRGQVPDADVDEALTPAPSSLPPAPPASFFSPVLQYPNLTVERTIVLPPPANVSRPQATKRRAIPPPQPVSQDTARVALLDEVGNHCCWSTKAASQSAFTGIVASHAFAYTLQTFTESRQVAFDFQPYVAGTPVDGPANGPPPSAWDVPAMAPNKFKVGIPVCLGYKVVEAYACTSCSSREPRLPTERALSYYFDIGF